MSAITRPDPVAVSLPLEVVVPRSVEERAVSMTTQGKPRAGTSGPREDIRTFDYIPRDGEVGQFKLFNYRHLASEIASETPRTLLDVVSDEEHEFDNYTFSSKPFSALEALILGPSDEKQEFENHKRSSKAPPAMKFMEQTNVSVWSKGNAFDHDPSTGFENHPGGSNRSCKVLHDQASDDIITANPKFRAAANGMLSPSRSRSQPANGENYGSHSEDPCGVMNSASNKEHIMEELPRSLRKNGGSRQDYNMSRSCLDGSLASMETPETQPTSVGIPREHIVAEKAGSPKSESNASTSTKHRENIEEVRSESDSCTFLLGDTSGKQKSVYPNVSPGHTGVKKGASHEVEAESPRRETPKSTSFFNPRRAKTLSGEEKVGEFHEESFISALDKLHISSIVSTQASIPANKALATKVKSEVKRAASVDFDHASDSTFGIGAWVENEPNHLRSLDVEGPHEVCLWQTDFGMLEDLFAPGWQAAFRTCQGNSTSGSGSQGANSFEAGSHGNRQSPPNSGNSHRKHPSDGGDGPGEDDDPVQSKKARTENETNRRFVCPFHVHDPTYFQTSMKNGQKFTHCAAGKGYADITRLKEHIKRVHFPEITCPRCGSTFEDQHGLDIHLRHEEGPECPILDLPTPRSMTADMMAKLSKRGKRESSCSEEDKWYKIYKLLFPNDSRPSTGPYWQDTSQPPTPSQEQQILIHMCESDLARLLGRRLDTTLGEILPDQEFRERMKNILISEVVACIKQLSVEPSETLNTFDGSHVLGHKQSGACSTDSGYVSRCGNTECLGNCGVCEQMVSSMSQPSREFIQPMSSLSFDPTEQYFNPSVFTNAESNGNLQSTENMDELLDHNFPPSYRGDLYFNGSGF